MSVLRPKFLTSAQMRDAPLGSALLRELNVVLQPEELLATAHS